MVDWETQDQFWIHNNARVGLQRITLLGFKFDLRFLRILKLLHIYSFGVLFIYFLYPYFILGQYSFFISEYRSIERDHWPEIYSGTSSFLIQILKKISIYFEDDYQRMCFPVKFAKFLRAPQNTFGGSFGIFQICDFLFSFLEFTNFWITWYLDLVFKEMYTFSLEFFVGP